MIPCNQTLVRTIRVLNRRERLPEGADARPLTVTATEHVPVGGLFGPCAKDGHEWPCPAYREVMGIVGPPWAELMSEARQAAQAGRGGSRP